ncbi:MAG TPA: HepT-like ribonuclease domain-containing protein [Dehalococcoidia bacterium]|nr:HepT-like ribonuclease domain-containing protein [Dehalococcoidia bacterium]
MLAAARRAISLIEGRTRGNLDEDDVLVLALTRLLEIVGEAARGVSDETRDAHPEVPWRAMAATRDKLIHGYFAVDLDVVWQIVRNDLPTVVEALNKMVPPER